jgi:hypothetical protein
MTHALKLVSSAAAEAFCCPLASIVGSPANADMERTVSDGNEALAAGQVVTNTHQRDVR